MSLLSDPTMNSSSPLLCQIQDNATSFANATVANASSSSLEDMIVDNSVPFYLREGNITTRMEPIAKVAPSYSVK